MQSLNCNAHHHGGTAAAADGSVTLPAAAAAPRRQRFSSLRKTGALTRVMRSRLSRSFYASGCERGAHSAAGRQAKFQHSHSPSISHSVSVGDSIRGSQAAVGAAGDADRGAATADQRILTELGALQLSATAASGTVVDIRSPSPAPKGASQPKAMRKKRSRLCVAL